MRLHLYSLRTACLLFLLLSLVACGRSSNDALPKLGIFQINSHRLLDETREGFIQAFKDSGYVHGKTVDIDVKNALGDVATARQIASNFAQEKDLICAISTPALQAALGVTETVPIVFGAIANPYRAGAGMDSTHHKANVTGASSTAPVFDTMRLITEILPHAKRVGVPWDPSFENAHVNVELCRQSAKKLGLTLVEVTISGTSEVMGGIQVLVDKEIDVVYTTADNTIYSAMESVIQVATNHGLAVFSNEPSGVERGVMVALGWNYFQNGVKSGKLAIRILRGENPANIPFESLTEQKLTVNLGVADRLGLTIPSVIVERADRVLK
jgi:putative ABC transport system substrate-binding protein